MGLRYDTHNLDGCIETFNTANNDKVVNVKKILSNRNTHTFYKI